MTARRQRARKARTVVDGVNDGRYCLGCGERVDDVNESGHYDYRWGYFRCETHGLTDSDECRCGHLRRDHVGAAAAIGETFDAECKRCGCRAFRNADSSFGGAVTPSICREWDCERAPGPSGYCAVHEPWSAP